MAKEDDDNLESMAEPGSQEVAEPRADWSQLWQMPILVAGVLLLGLGVYLAMPRRAADDFPGKLDQIEALLTNEQFAAAEEELLALQPHIARALPAEQARYQVLQGDHHHLLQKQGAVPLPERDRLILAAYGRARELHHPFDRDRLRRWALAHVRLGDYDAALNLLEDQPQITPADRQAVLRLMIERLLDQSPVDYALASDLIERFETLLREAAASVEQPIEALLWAAGLKVQLLLDTGQPEQALAYVSQRMVRFFDQGLADRMQMLKVRRAQVHQQLGRYDEARRWFLDARDELPREAPEHGEILVGLGQIALAQDADPQAALQYFSRAEELYQNAHAYLPALIGRADCEARTAAHFEAREHFSRAVELLRQAPRRERLSDQLVEMIQSHFTLNFDHERFDLALDYLSLLSPLYQDQSAGGLPPHLLEAFARTHERIAQRLLADAARLPLAPPDAAPGPSEAPGDRGLTWQQAAFHFRQSGDHYLEHAHAQSADPAAYADSLWAAANNYDQAQRHPQAIAVCLEFLNNCPQDARHVAARNRLGLAYMADGQYAAARDAFLLLVNERPKNPETYDSLVPLARSHIQLGEYDAAQRVLHHVLEDHPSLNPEAAAYREAMIELGRLYYRRENFERAIEWLDQAVQRYGRGPEGAALHFRLANAYRRSAQAIAQEMEQSVPPARRRGFEQLRRERLAKAQRLFDLAIAAFEAGDLPIQDPLEQAFRRNAYFYRADCAFDLGQYQEAIALYDLAVRRYEQDPAALAGLIQIVNAYCRLDDYAAARVANQRARWQLQHIPDEKFNDPSLPLTRAMWEEWLRFASERDLFDSQANATAPSPAPE